MTLLTTIKVATPRVTLTMDANAMKRVFKYRHDKSNLYIRQSFGLVKANLDESVIDYSRFLWVGHRFK